MFVSVLLEFAWLMAVSYQVKRGGELLSDPERIRIILDYCCGNIRFQGGMNE